MTGQVRQVGLATEQTPQQRRTARIAGWLFIATFVTAIAALPLYDPVLNNADYILGGGFDTRISFGALMEVLLVITNIGMAMLGLIGGPLIFASCIAVLFGAYEQTDGVHFLFSIPEIASEASLGIYLIVKGFRPSPILA
jgi:hypothetical protein